MTTLEIGTGVGIKIAEQYTQFIWNRDESITNSVEIILRDGGINLVDPVQRGMWDQFQHKLEGVNRKLLVFACNIPPEWVTNNNIKLVNTHYVLRHQLRDLKRKIATHRYENFNRQCNHIQYDFMMTYGIAEQHRETLVSVLEDKDVLKNSLYSRPYASGRQAHTLEDTLNSNSADVFDTESAQGYKPIQNYRYDHHNNFEFMIESTQKCHCAIALLNNAFREEMCGHLNEKFLWPILAQVPMLWAMTSRQREQMLSWGFRENEASRTNVRSFVEQAWWLKTVFSDPKVAQQWQDDQGATCNHNLSVLKRLADRIDEDTQKQLSPLGLA